jgi:hypothetical protein
MNIQEMSLELGYDLIRLILNKISFSCSVVWIKYLLESNYSCLWKHVENYLFLSNFMKISSPSLNIFPVSNRHVGRRTSITICP